MLFQGERKLTYPIIQAPMAGITTAELVASVSNFGGLGNIGVGYLSSDETREIIQAVKQQTDKAFGVNLFVPEASNTTEAEIASALESLEFCKVDLQMDDLLEGRDITAINQAAQFHNQIEVVLAEKIPVCSFTFGIPSSEVIRELKSENIYLIGTATTIAEAIEVEKAGLDAVVLQGSEAGGHRGTFLQEDTFQELSKLIKEVSGGISIPFIAAGGIMNGEELRKVIENGASAAQLGTAFLTTTESGANQYYKQALLRATESDVTYTKAFSGKMAQGIKNKFMKKMQVPKTKILPYPFQNSLTQALRIRAAKLGNADYMSLWAGKGVANCEALSVQEFMNKLISEMDV